MDNYDAIIVGSGAAGLSAALVLGRARRRVLVLDGGSPRNAPAGAAHGVFTRDGTPPLELLRIAREQLHPYGGVELRPAPAVGISRLPDADGFELVLADDERVRGRMVILATGVVDRLPDIPGFRERWGNGVYHCPYCHGWEVRDEPLAVYAAGEDAMHMAPLIRNWSRSLTLLTGGPDSLTERQRQTLDRLEIARNTQRIARLEDADDGQLRVVFVDGGSLTVRGIFVATSVQPRNELAVQIGCELIDDGKLAGMIKVDPNGATSIPGVYAAGDVAGRMQQVTSAVASGAVAAAMLNHALVQNEIATLTDA